MTQPERQKQDEELVAKAVSDLGEHFDAVLVLVSRHEPTVENGTVTVEDGCGDFNAKFGLARSYVVYAEEQVRYKARRDSIENG